MLSSPKHIAAADGGPTMHAVARKQKEPSQRATPDSAKSSPARSQPLHQRSRVLDLQRTVGNQAVLRLLQQTKDAVGSAPGTFERAGPGPDVGTVLVDNALPLKIQPNLAMSTPGDADEREAERIADSVMGLPAAQTQQGQGETIGGLPGPATSLQPGSSPAHPLHQSPRRFMEARFGHDFSQVQVHADAKAAESARSIHALAFTVGRDIVFGAGQYAPNTHRGLHLLAHELAHVVRQPNDQAVIHRQAVVPPTRPAAEDDRREFVRDTIKFFESSAKFFGDPLVKIDPAVFERVINTWYLMVESREAMINTDLKGDASLI